MFGSLQASELCSLDCTGLSPLKLFSPQNIKPGVYHTYKCTLLRYFDYAVSANEILREVEQGPDSIACLDTSSNQPPYLNTNYWQSSPDAN